MYVDLIDDALQQKESNCVILNNVKKIVKEGIDYGDVHCFILLKDAVEIDIPKEQIINKIREPLVKKYGQETFENFVKYMNSPTLEEDAARFISCNRLTSSQQSLVNYCLSKSINIERYSDFLSLMAMDAEIDARLDLIEQLVIKLKTVPVLGVDGLTFKKYLYSISEVIACIYLLKQLLQANIRLNSNNLEKINSYSKQLNNISDFINDDDYNTVHNAAVNKTSNLIKSFNKRLFKDEYNFDAELLKGSLDSLTLLFQFISGVLNNVQNKCLKEYTSIGISLDHLLQK